MTRVCSARQSQIHSGYQIREGCEPRPRRRIHSQYALHGFLGGLVVNNPPANAGGAGDDDLLPGSGRSPGEGMATHFSILAWRIAWTEEPAGLQSKGSQKSWTCLKD